MTSPLQPPITCLITKGEATAENFARKTRETLEVIEAAAADGVSLIQIREKALPAKLLFEFAREAASLLRRSETKLLVNGRLDVALASGAAGVHLPSDSMPIADVRALAPEGFIIGASTHSLEEALNAKECGADLIVYGPVFATAMKSLPVGLSALRDVCAALSDFPVLAIGGVEERNFSEVMSAGAAGFAAIGSLNDRARRVAILTGSQGMAVTTADMANPPAEMG